MANSLESDMQSWAVMQGASNHDMMQWIEAPIRHFNVLWKIESECATKAFVGMQVWGAFESRKNNPNDMVGAK